jgi:hypothetical protein
MFRATLCSSSGESVVSIHQVYVTLCQWPFRVQVGKELSDLHTKRSPTQSDIYQMLYWYNWFSRWWAQGCSKHVENWNKDIEKNCALSWSFTKNHSRMHGQQNIKLLTAISSLPYDRMFQQWQSVLIIPYFATRIWMLLSPHTLHVVHDRCVTLMVAAQICSREWQAKVVIGRTSFANRCFN